MAAKGTKSRARRTTKREDAKVFHLEEFLKDRVTSEPVLRAVRRFDDSAANKDLAVAVEKLQRAVKDLGARVSDIEATANERIESLRARARELTPSWDDVSERALDEVDTLLDRVGLMRTSVHEAELAALKKKLRAARAQKSTRRAETTDDAA
jgi:hypothetical protein